MKKKPARHLAVIFTVAGFFIFQGSAEAGLGEFFKKVGNSIAHPQPRSKSRQPSRKSDLERSTAKPLTPQNQDGAVNARPTPANNFETIPENPATPTPTPSQATIRAASAARTAGRPDIPFGIPIPNRPGFVTSPYAPNQGLVDVRGFPSGTEVKDPYTNKVFLTP